MQRSSSTGNIYDLGYRPYDGARLGRNYAIMSLFWYSLRSIFGLGRSGWAKVFPFGLAGLAVLPAVAQIAIAAIAPDDVTFVAPYNHFRFIQVIIALFCIVAAPDLIGRDQRSRTLTLYFSRAMSRIDYVTAKLGAMTIALFIVTLIPQALLLIGNAIAADDVLDYLNDNAADIPATVASCVAIALLMASLSLTIAVQSSRRAIATVALGAAFFISFGLSGILAETLTGGSRWISMVVSPFTVLEGLTYWLFDVTPTATSQLAEAGIDGYMYLLISLVYIGVSLGVLYRRFQRMAV